ncbi:MAG: hypothetical protein JXM73_16855 [Anaerolineae bacterium]|nr:hypothetical protein [Anaerolineae bacterium]
MRIDGTYLPTAMLAIHAAEMEQAARCPEWQSANRLERNLALYQGGHRTICLLGCLLEKTGRRLQEYGMPSPLVLEGNAAQR